MNKVSKDGVIIKNIFKNVLGKKRKCLLCENFSINSHLLQKNGILNNISENGHLIQIKPKDISIDHKNGIVDIDKIGINKGMSYNLFCNFHDTKVFESIEQKEFELNNYKNQLLFSYRSLCAEIRKKEINIDVYNRIINSSHFSLQFGFLENIKIQKEANKLGIDDMIFYKNEFENEILNYKNNNFIFKLYEYDFLPISASAVYTPIDPLIHTKKYLLDKKNVLNIIFINLLPINNKLYLLLGYHKNNFNEWIEQYIGSWENISHKELTIKLTDLLSTKIETWAISPSYFKSIKKNNLNKFLNYWNEHAMDLRINQKIGFNLFDFE